MPTPITSRRTLSVALLVLGLSACGIDSSYNSTNLGSVSIGQQLIDLKAAQENDLLSEKEYQMLRTKLIRTLTESLDAEDQEGDDDRKPIHRDDDNDDDDDDDDDGWLF